MTLNEILKAKRAHVARLANQSGAAGEAHMLESMDYWIARPKGSDLKNLLLALAQCGITIKGSSFDAISVSEEKEIDFSDINKLVDTIPLMTFIEIKTANQSRVKDDFSGFFFALTEGEIAASEALGSRHKVVLFNKLTGNTVVTSVAEILSRTKSMNWQLSVQL